jgi:peptidoglycan/LPS O-acetylase OafA/YrhL
MNPITDSPKFRPFMLKVAIMGGALLLVALVLKLAGVHYNDALLTVGFGTLAVVAFFLGQMFPGTHRVGAPLWKFAMTLTGYSLAAALIGVLFIIMHWPGGDKMMLIGVGCVAVCAIAWLVYVLYYKKNKNNQIFEEENN